MKKTFLLLMIMGLIPSVMFSQKRETRQVSGFTGIDASSVFNITVTKGDSESLSIEADDAVMKYVRSEVKNGVLYLFLDKDNNVRNVNVLKATITMKNLDKVSLSGACKFASNDLFTSSKFKCDCSGASQMTANVSTGQLIVEASGASKIQIKANVSGSADFDVSGVSKTQGELNAPNVTIDCSGVSSIELTGSATNLTVDASGTAKVNTENFKVKTANVETSGTVKVSVNVIDHLQVDSSGASSIIYKGSPSINMKGQAAQIRKM